MKDWTNKSIAELGRVVTGKTPPMAEPKYFGGQYMFVSPKDLEYDMMYVHDTQTKITDIALKKFKNQVLSSDAIMFTSLSYSFGKIGIASKPCLTNQQINSVIVNNENDSRFVYYLLRLGKQHIFQYNSGIDTPIVPKSVFEKIKFLVPSLPVQQSIASILSAYDELIEVNNQRIKLLEETARELYKEWFVRMRFPGYKKAKFVKGVPEGWEVKKLGDILDFKTGKLNSNAAKEDGRYPFFTCSNADFRTDTFSFDTEAVLLAGNNAAGIYPLKYYKGKFDAYQRTYIIKPQKEWRWISHKYIFYYFLERLEFLQVISIGAATQFLTTQMLKKISMLIAEEKIMYQFSSIIDPIFDQLQILQQQNTQLRQIRDRLLPRLVSGKLAVKVPKQYESNEALSMAAEP